MHYKNVIASIIPPPAQHRNKCSHISESNSVFRYLYLLHLKLEWIAVIRSPFQSYHVQNPDLKIQKYTALTEDHILYQNIQVLFSRNNNSSIYMNINF